MRRVAILGCPGSGKSTLARQLGERLGLPVIHLDTLYWLPGWRQPDSATYRARFADAFTGEAWVSEGNFIETFASRLPRADLVVILDRSRLLCLWRALRRAGLSRYRRFDLPAGCPEQFDIKLLRDIWRYHVDGSPRLEAALAEHGGGTPIIRLRSNREVAAFLAGLSRPRPSPAP